MGKILVIAEKPSAGADMAKVLGCNQKGAGYMEGEKYIVTWSVGHLVGLKYPEEHNEKYKTWNLEDIPFDFDIKDSLKVLPGTQSQFSVIKKLIQRSDVDSIINAGDAGREGYLIQEWIYRLAGNRKLKKVLWSSSLTEEALKKAFSDLKHPEDFRLLLEEAEARALGDYCMGINYSRALTLTLGKQHNVKLKYGRCQTPLLHLIVARDEEIENFVSRPYCNILLQYEKGFSGVLLAEKKKPADIFDPEEEKGLLAKLREDMMPAVIKEYESTDKKQTAPALLNLAELQKQMGSSYGYEPGETLEIAQSLYEKHKVLSYPRTDSRALSMDVYREIKEHIRSCSWGEFKRYVESIDMDNIQTDKKYFNDLKVTDHHALIPTIHSDMQAAYEQMSDRERNVFTAVLRSFLAIFYSAYEYQVTEVIAEKCGYRFYSKGMVITHLGYKEVFALDEEDDDADKEDKLLPILQIGEALVVEEVEVVSKKTNPPARYTVSSIVVLMEKNRIGTSATRSEIIKKLMDQQAAYIQLNKGKYASTQLGREYIAALPETLKDVQLTQKFEKRLQEISEGKLSKEAFLKQLKQEEEEMIRYLKTCNIEVKQVFKSDSNKDAAKCPKCGKPIRENQKAYGCTGYQAGCDFVIWKAIAGKNITESMVKQLLTKGETGKLKGFKKRDGSGTYEAALQLKDGKVVFKRG